MNNLEQYLTLRKHYKYVYFKTFIGVQWLYIVLVSAVQRSESALCYMYPLFLGFPFHLGHH